MAHCRVAAAARWLWRGPEVSKLCFHAKSVLLILQKSCNADLSIAIALEQVEIVPHSKEIKFLHFPMLLICQLIRTACDLSLDRLRLNEIAEPVAFPRFTAVVAKCQCTI